MTRSRLLTLLLALCLLWVTPASLADGEETEQPASEIAADCALTLPERSADRAYRITDETVESFLALRAGDAVSAALPDGVSAQGVYLEWYTQPEDYVLEQLDASGAVLLTDAAQPYINCYHVLDVAARGGSASGRRAGRVFA